MIYVVEVIIQGEIYFLLGLDGTVSKNIIDAIFFVNKNVASYYATQIESIICGSLGRLRSLTIHEMF